MNNVMTNGFCELNENEMMTTEGGSVLIFIGGIAAGILVEGVTKAATGKSASDWVAESIQWAADKIAGAF